MPVDLPQRFEDILNCTFCGAPQPRTRKLIAGPNIYICDQCIQLALTLLTSDGPITSRHVRLELARADAGDRCGFCGKRAREVSRMIAGDGAYICDECLGLCGQMLIEEAPA